LVSAGFKEETIEGLDPAERLAFLVILGEQNGNEFNWEALSWKKR